MFLLFKPPSRNSSIFIRTAAAATAMEAVAKATAQLTLNQKKKQKCRICLEDVDSAKMLELSSCHHKFCSSCIEKHVKLKLKSKELPGCPRLNCGLNLNKYDCRKFLTPRMYDTMDQLMKESSIPVTQKVYCPNPRCSNLMSKTEALAKNMSVPGTSKVELYKGRCMKCYSVFCINCKVLWHYSYKSCVAYKESQLGLDSDEAKLKVLAGQKKWSQCSSCSHMVELAHGCYHISCRCGHQFCYLCGREWKDKRTTCSSSCPLWSEENIIPGGVR